MKEKTYYFKIEGRVYARDDDDAREQVEKMAVVGKNCERCEYDIKEISD